MRTGIIASSASGESKTGGISAGFEETLTNQRTFDIALMHLVHSVTFTGRPFSMIVTRCRLGRKGRLVARLECDTAWPKVTALLQLLHFAISKYPFNKQFTTLNASFSIEHCELGIPTCGAKYYHTSGFQSMSEENKAISASAPLGKIEISPLAVATIAAYAVTRSYGVVGMAPKNVVEGIAATLTNDPHKGIQVQFNHDGVRIDLYLVVEYGTRIATVARSAANTVRFNVEKSTGLTVTEVNVFVQGLRVSHTD